LIRVAMLCKGGTMSDEDVLTTGLALAGGGFRATLFHVGALRRLNELGWLRKIDIITSVSGGSIIAGVLARNWQGLAWQTSAQGPVATNFVDLIEAPIRDFCGRTIDVAAGLIGLVSPFSSIAEEVAKAYDEHLFHGFTLQKLPSFQPGVSPRFVFYATSFQTGSSVRISSKYLADYRVGCIDKPDFPLAKVVASSSAFPPVLSPVVFTFDDTKVWQPLPGADQHGNEALKRRLVLGDGGIYDNLGLEGVWERCATVLVSDAGAPMAIDPEPWTDPASQMGRVRDILINQTRALRKRKLVQDFENKLRAGTYWGITTRIGDYQLPDAMTGDTDRTAAQQHVRTRLNRFNAQEQGELVNWGYALADAAMRKHVVPGTPVGQRQWPDMRYGFP
jgi:NTE family protein